LRYPLVGLPWWQQGLLLVGLILAQSSCQQPPTPVASTQSAVKAPVVTTECVRMDLSGKGWKLLLDPQAPWASEPLVINPEVLQHSHLPASYGATTIPATSPASTAPSTMPSGPYGWPHGPAQDLATLLSKPETINVSVPGTVEQYFWEKAANPHETQGNYQGVSWWLKEFTLPDNFPTAQHVYLHFQACRYRAEVFVNNQPVGYDIVGSTPFSLDITQAVKRQGKNLLAVRITDPNDNTLQYNFNWADYAAIPWGATNVPAVHGFGGIHAPVWLESRPANHISDLVVRNKPSPSTTQPSSVDVLVEFQQPPSLPGTLEYRITPHGQADQTVWQHTLPLTEELLKKPVAITADVPGAKLWDLKNPNLYDCIVRLRQGDQVTDVTTQRFGFRWFAPEDVGGADAVFRLNGQRVVVRGAISWGYWPVNGIFPTREQALHQIRQAKILGLNLLAMHRAIADPLVIEAADELGMLIYSEPGGYKCDYGNNDARTIAREKLLRLVRRDRSYPSVVMWGMINEIWVKERQVLPSYLKDMVDAHALDPSRAIMLASGQGGIKGEPRAEGSWMPPYGDKRLEVGFSNEHRAGGPGVYHDGLWSNPQSYSASDGNPANIIYWGEDGAISNPPQLDKLKAFFEQSPQRGWDGDDFLRMHKEYTKWFAQHGGLGGFDNQLDVWARRMGNVTYYYHGRLIENIRTNNKTDGYMINGWECMKLDNHSGIVDQLRNMKGDPDILAYYNRPLHLAVKLRTKVTQPDTSVVADVLVANEVNLKGKLQLKVVTLRGQEQLQEQTWDVELTGGETFGQLLRDNITVPVGNVAGRVRVVATLSRGAEVVVRGEDEVFVINYRDLPLPAQGAVHDQSGQLTRFLQQELKYEVTDLTKADTVATPPAWLLVGIIGPQGDAIIKRYLDLAQAGTRLIVVAEPERWAAAMAERKWVTYEGTMAVPQNWVGGMFFALDHPVLDGLPTNQGLNWEYQVIQTSRQRKGFSRYALLLGGDQCALGAWNHHEPRLGSVLSVVKTGTGSVTLCTADLCRMVVETAPQLATAKRLLVNTLRYAPKP